MNKYLRIGLSLLAITVPLALAQDEVTAEQFAAEHASPAFTLQGDALSATSMLELAYQCLGSGAQVEGDLLVTTGFHMLDARAYQLRGPQALATSLRRAEINAQTHAVEFFEAVRVRSRTIMADTDTTVARDTIANDDIMSHFKMTTVETLSTVTSVQVEGYLRGGRKAGTKLISLGDQGMCVGVRYELPLDQAGFDPVERARNESGTGTAPAPADTADDEGNKGFEAPPPGTIGDW